MPHGYGWFSGNGFPYSGDALIFYIKSELRKWDFKKGYDGRMVSNQCCKFIHAELWNSSP